MNNNNNNNNNFSLERDTIINFLDNKIQIYSLFRTILYSQIDTMHFSPTNIEIFKVISEIQIRLDELYSIKLGLPVFDN